MVCEESSASETAPSLELLKIASVESSDPSSVESSFRELDDAFLQTQTRIWLGEVLHLRLDEQLIISELLADGELLFQVSKLAWKLMLAKHMDLRLIKAYKSQPFSSKKNSGRYRPYSHVDFFLKICKILGLTGVDLFSPSDVVEKRNTRRVCMCIRSFSKKLRFKNINVPDFDIVTCMVAMPKDMVRCIRRNLELYQSILADSSSFYVQKHGRGKSGQGYSVTSSTRNYETYSDQSDDTEIKHPSLQFEGLHTDHWYDYTSEINHNVLSPTVNDLDQLDTQNQQRNEIPENEFELSCSMESLQYHCSENIEHDCKLIWSSLVSCGDLRVGFSGMRSHLDTRVEQAQESRIRDFDYFEHDWLRNNGSGIGNPLSDKTPVAKDASSNGKNLFHEENITPNVRQSAGSHGSNSTPWTIENVRRCSEIGDNMEVLHADGVSCLSRKVMNLGDQFEAEKNFQNSKSFKLHNDKNDQWNKIKEEDKSRQIMKYKEMESGIPSNARYSYFVKEFDETEHSLYSPDCYFCQTDSSDRAGSCQSEEVLSCQSYSLPEFWEWDQKGKYAMISSKAEDNRSSSCSLEDGSQETITPCKQKYSEVLMSKVMLSCVPGEEDVIIAAVVKSKALASNVPTVGDDANDFFDTEDDGDGAKGVLDMITNDVVVPAHCDEGLSHAGSCLTNQSLKLECDDCLQPCQYDIDPVYNSEHTHEMHNEEEMRSEDESMHSFENLVETKEGSIEMPKGKPQRKILLKSVLGGAAAFGLLFAFLHFRRNGGEEAPQSSKASSHKGKEKIQKYSPQKVQRSRTEKVYSAGKLKLK